MYQTLKLDGFGYRSESYSGSGVRDLEQVLNYEMFELGNSDVISYVYKNYEWFVHDSAFSLIEEIATSAASEFEERGGMTAFVEVGEQLIAYVTRVVQRELGDGPFQCVWLTSEEACRAQYAIDGCIERWRVTDCMLPISDLGADGVLFAYCTGVCQQL